MRILHTSDWHLGRSFHKEDLLGHQGVFIDHLVDAVRDQHVDVVVVSGDVYDRAMPAVDAVDLGSQAFRRLASAGARVVVISGNHDSARRMGAHSDLIDAAGVHFRTVADHCDRPVVIDDEHGPVAFYAIPYLDPEAMRLPWALPARSHQLALSTALERVRADLESRSCRSVVLAHAFVAGANAADSEREICVGGVDRVGVESFDGFTYAALGHLHRSQALTDSVRYSGSPLAFSFSEANDCKGSWLVDLDEAGLNAVAFVEAPVPRRLRRLTGSLQELLNSPAFDDAEAAWVEANLTDQVRPRGAYEQLQRRFPHLMIVRFPQTELSSGITRQAPVAGLSPVQVTRDFVSTVRGKEVSLQESALIDATVATVLRAEEQVAG